MVLLGRKNDISKKEINCVSSLILNPPSPNQIEWSAKRAGCWITLHMHDSHIYVHNCIKRMDYSIHGDIQLKYRSFFPINRLERQKGAG